MIEIEYAIKKIREVVPSVNEIEDYDDAWYFYISHQSGRSEVGVFVEKSTGEILYECQYFGTVGRNVKKTGDKYHINKDGKASLHNKCKSKNKLIVSEPYDGFSNDYDRNKCIESLKPLVCKEYDKLKIGAKSSVSKLINIVGYTEENFKIYMEIYYHLAKYADRKGEALKFNLPKTPPGKSPVPIGVPYNFTFTKSRKK